MSSTPVDVRRTGKHIFTATNDRGAEVTIGRDGAPGAFTPGELLLAAIAGCSAVTSESMLIRRLGESAALDVHADRTKTEDDPHKFAEVQVRFDVDLGSIEDAGERAKLVDAVQRAIERLCTVSRSVEEGTPISLELPRD
ncbi:OsmC family protein [Saccharopolyspora erythraea]|uniref:OsmC family protein n=1 Tax=Saccharopolyspora erythraea TaxID=1836 RepID=UPI001BA64F68|nr:OsmC family protein [Saccharopolyspora erythraea]QUH01651.1 OsmC family protein [Saccharopolyspora erythraea]